SGIRLRQVDDRDVRLRVLDDVERFSLPLGEDDVEALQRECTFQREAPLPLVVDNEQAPGHCSHPSAPTPSIRPMITAPRKASRDAGESISASALRGPGRSRYRETRARAGPVSSKGG